MKLRFKSKLLMMAVIPCLIVCACMCVVTIGSLDKNITLEIRETLRATAYSLAFDEPQEALEGYKNTLGIDVTIFNENVREKTTVEGSVGTEADPSIYAKVRSGEEYFSTNANVNGKEYFGYYIPIYEEGNFIGMSFAGKPTEEAQAVIIGTASKMLGATMVVIVAVIAIVIVIAGYMTKLMKNSTDLISEVSQGNFAVNTDAKVSGDEIGEIYRQAGELAKNMRERITNIIQIANKLSEMSVDMSNSTNVVSNNTSEINRAVDEIASGAMDQAEHVQDASKSMTNVNDSILAIQEQISELENISASMQSIEEDVMQQIDTLKSINLKTNEELKEVEEKVAKTSEAINNIQKATDIIRNIASETKLLSLNASIEAAHAGEAGKGFAVVAEEVSKLAQESDSASGDIEEILRELLVSYEDVTASVGRLVENMDKQSESITDTYGKIVVLDGNIGSATKSIGVISESCTKAKDLSGNVVDAFASLSAISEQNAAGCEETNASVQELNATIVSVNSEANALNDISKALVDQVEIFKV